jgi:hypothetical protein
MGGDHDPGIDSFVNIQKFPYFSGWRQNDRLPFQARDFEKSFVSRAANCDVYRSRVRELARMNPWEIRYCDEWNDIQWNVKMTKQGVSKNVSRNR